MVGEPASLRRGREVHTRLGLVVLYSLLSLPLGKATPVLRVPIIVFWRQRRVS